MVTFSTRDSHEELVKKLKIRKPRWKNFDLEDNTVISDEEYNDKDTRPSYICDICQTTLQYNDIDKSYWCNTCVMYIQPKDTKKVVDFEIPQSAQDIEPAITSVDYTLGDTDRVKIDHRPQPKGSFAELQRKGLRITDLLRNKMHKLKDTTTGENYIIHVCYECDPDQYPTGKRILPEDTLARPNDKGRWIYGECKIEELNKRVLGLQHPDVKAFIQKEDNDCKRWNNYVKRVNQNIGAGLKYKKNRYTGMTPFD